MYNITDLEHLSITPLILEQLFKNLLWTKTIESMEKNVLNLIDLLEHSKQYTTEHIRLLPKIRKPGQLHSKGLFHAALKLFTYLYV